MIGNSQTFTKHNSVKFENCLPSGRARFYRKLHQKSDFRLLSDVTVDQYRSDESEDYIKHKHTQSSKLTAMQATFYFRCSIFMAHPKLIYLIQLLTSLTHLIVFKSVSTHAP